MAEKQNKVPKDGNGDQKSGRGKGAKRPDKRPSRHDYKNRRFYLNKLRKILGNQGEAAAAAWADANKAKAFLRDLGETGSVLGPAMRIRARKAYSLAK